MRSDFISTFSAYLREIPESLTAFAKRTGTTATTISQVLKGTRAPPADSVEAWADGLELTGETRRHFIIAGARMKAEAQMDAIPYLEAIHEHTGELRDALASLLAVLYDQGFQVPDSLRERLQVSDDFL